MAGLRALDQNTEKGGHVFIEGNVWAGFSLRRILLGIKQLAQENISEPGLEVATPRQEVSGYPVSLGVGLVFTVWR